MRQEKEEMFSVASLQIFHPRGYIPRSSVLNEEGS